MRRNPGTTLASFLALMLGIGASTAIFSIVNGIMLKPLPVKDGRRLVRIYSTNPTSDNDNVSMADFLDWRRDARSLSGLALYGLCQVTLTGAGTPERIIAGQADSNFFPLLGVVPVQGQGFRAGAENRAGETEVMLTWEFWQRHFAGQNVLGRKMILDEKPYTIIGVLPKNLSAVAKGDIWLPLRFDLAADENQRGFHTYMAVGKLAAGRTIAEATHELVSLSARLAAEYPRQNEGLSARAIPLSEASSAGGQSALQGKIRPTLALLFGAVLCILVLACVNVANIGLTRALTRQREIATRAAVGASNSRLFQQLLIESVLVSLAASAAGLGLAALSVRLFRSLPLPSIPRLAEVTIDWRVLSFSTALGIIAGVFVSLLPAYRLTRASVFDALKRSAGSSTEATAQRRMRAFFVAVQAALATALLIESSLLLKSLFVASEIQPGLTVHHVLTMYLSLPSSRYNYRQPGHVGPFAQAVLDRIRALPGVQDAAITTDLPFTTHVGGGGILAEGQIPEKQSWNAPVVYWTMISPAYFRTMQIPLLKGHDFDAHSNTNVVIVNRAFAKRFFGGANPVGRRVAPVEPEIKWREIIGLVPDVSQKSVEDKTIPQMFLSVTHLDPPWVALVVRTRGNPLNYVQAIRERVADVDKSVAAFLPQTLEQLLEKQFLWRRLQTWIVGAFAAVSLILVLLGINAVIVYSVDRRIRELGLRAALGASRSIIVRTVVWEGSAPAILGTLAGMGLGFAGARATEQMLFNVSATDATPYLMAAAILGFAALVATYIPARRAAAIDPWVALRHE